MRDVERVDLDASGDDREEDECEQVVCEVWNVVLSVGYYSWWSPLPVAPGVDYLALWRADMRAVVVRVGPVRG